MASIVTIQNSTGKTPFEICDEQYFYCTNTEISMLVSLFGGKMLLIVTRNYLTMPDVKQSEIIGAEKYGGRYE